MSLRHLILIGLAALLGACSHDAPPPAPAPEDTSGRLELRFEASTTLNPGTNGQPAPVRVHLFELKNSAAFVRADYFSLTDHATATLAADLLDQDELQVRPGEKRTLKRQLNAATRHVALQVGYRDLDHAAWRQIIDLPPSRSGIYRVNLDTQAVSSVELQPTTGNAP